MLLLSLLPTDGKIKHFSSFLPNFEKFESLFIKFVTDFSSKDASVAQWVRRRHFKQWIMGSNTNQADFF